MQTDDTIVDYCWLLLMQWIKAKDLLIESSKTQRLCMYDDTCTLSIKDRHGKSIVNITLTCVFPFTSSSHNEFTVLSGFKQHI